MHFLFVIYHWLKIIGIFLFNSMSYNIKDIIEMWEEELDRTQKANDLVQKELTKPIHPVETFFNNELDRLKKVVEKSDEESVNANVDDIFYNLTEYTEQVKIPGNDLEKKWKRNVLYCNTPRGNIIMYYDPFKRAFSYYCEDSAVIYKVLNACAMKYVRIFSCLDFFVDDSVVEGFVSPLIEIMKGELEPVKKEVDGTVKPKEIKKAPFAKFKRYNLESSDKDGKTKSLKFVVKNTNKFVYLGKTREFNPLNSIPMVKAAHAPARTKYDGMFEGEQEVQQRAIKYSDFKNAVNSNMGVASTKKNAHITGKENVSYGDFKKMKAV